LETGHQRLGRPPPRLFDFNSHCHFDSEVTAAAIEGKDGAGAGWKPSTNG